MKSLSWLRTNSTIQIESFAEYIARIAILPSKVRFSLLKTAIGHQHAFAFTSHCAARWPGIFGIYGRRALYKSIVRKVGKEVSINFGTILTKSTTELDDYVYIGASCVIGDVSIGRKTLIGDRVCILSGSSQHGTSRLDIPIADQPQTYRKIHIGADCWIGSGSVIMADIGDHCVIGAGSVVTKPTSDYQIIVGNPAKSIGDRRDRTDKT